MRTNALIMVSLATMVAGAIVLAPLSAASVLSKYPDASGSSQSNDRTRSGNGSAPTSTVVSPPSDLLSGLHHHG